MKRLIVLLILLLAGSCGGTETVTSSARARPVTSTGLDLFNERVVGSNPGCVTCHSLDEGITIVGPSLFVITSRVDGMNVADYIEQSIVDPDAFIVDGFSAGQMTGGWSDLLTESQIQSLVELLTR